MPPDGHASYQDGAPKPLTDAEIEKIHAELHRQKQEILDRAAEEQRELTPEESERVRQIDESIRNLYPPDDEPWSDDEAMTGEELDAADREDRLTGEELDAWDRGERGGSGSGSGEGGGSGDGGGGGSGGGSGDGGGSGGDGDGGGSGGGDGGGGGGTESPTDDGSGLQRPSFGGPAGTHAIGDRLGGIHVNPGHLTGPGSDPRITDPTPD